MLPPSSCSASAGDAMAAGGFTRLASGLAAAAARNSSLSTGVFALTPLVREAQRRHPTDAFVLAHGREYFKATGQVCDHECAPFWSGCAHTRSHAGLECGGLCWWRGVSCQSPLAQDDGDKPQDKACTSCGTVSTSPLLCGQCRSVRYCNPECQREHWRAHKFVCAPQDGGAGAGSTTAAAGAAGATPSEEEDDLDEYEDGSSAYGSASDSSVDSEDERQSAAVFQRQVEEIGRMIGFHRGSDSSGSGSGSGSGLRSSGSGSGSGLLNAGGGGKVSFRMEDLMNPDRIATIAQSISASMTAHKVCFALLRLRLSQNLVVCLSAVAVVNHACLRYPRLQPRSLPC
jgi:hypothetical protein